MPTTRTPKSTSKRGGRKTSSRKTTRARKTRARSSSSRKTASSRGRGKVGKVMHEYSSGSLRSGSGGKVKNRKQAIAIGLSEARRSGEHVPPKKKSSRSRR